MKASMTVKKVNNKSGQKISIDVYLSPDEIEKLPGKPLGGPLIINGSGKSKHSKIIYLSTGSTGSASPVVTFPFPHGQSMEKTLGYRVTVDFGSYLSLKEGYAVTGNTFKEAIRTNVYYDRRLKAR